MKGVFDTKPNSGYDDDITRRYHFPAQYRSAAVGSDMVQHLIALSGTIHWLFDQDLVSLTKEFAS